MDETTPQETARSVTNGTFAAKAATRENPSVPAGLHMDEVNYKRTFDQSPTGMEIYDANGMLLEINRAALDIFGVASIEEVKRFNLFSDPNIDEQIRAKVQRGESATFETEFNFELVKKHKLYPTSKSGILNIDCLITPIISDEQAVTGYLVHVRDITQRKAIELALVQSEKRFRALIEHSTDAITMIDTNARVIYESPSVQLLSGFTFDERVGHNGLELILPEDIAYLQKVMGRVMAQPNYIESAQFRAYRKDGSIQWLEGTAINLLQESSVRAIVINYRDITDRVRAEKALKEANDQLSIRIREVTALQAELREQALRDPLTGLYNRRYLNDAMERELARVQRERHSLSVIVMDIDHLKKINDNHGHQIGDQFLTEIAQLISKHARSSDIACRFGGEEFLLVMPGAALKTALKRAELIRAQCEGLRIAGGKKSVGVTMSMGVATFPKHGKGAEEIVNKADKAMYRAKRAGRNCVVAWEKS